MYRQSENDVFKHMDFIILDLICLELAFIVSIYVRHGELTLMGESLYRSVFFVLMFSQLIISIVFESFKDVLKRGYYKEFSATLKHCIEIMVLVSVYLFLIQRGGDFSRLIWLSTSLTFVIFTYGARIVYKSFLQFRLVNMEGKKSVLVITSRKKVRNVINSLVAENYEGIRITGIVLYDRDWEGTHICNIPIVANISNVIDYVQKGWVDEVFLDMPKDISMCTELLEKFTVMGTIVHLNLLDLQVVGEHKQMIENLGSFPVLTYSINMAPRKQLVLKRIIDICGGIVGCVITLILTLILGPLIFIQSPGPIFFSQERVGKNGKKFKCYKFRSMYMDAEERKKELMNLNKVEDGRMFKMENDPRIIGSEKGQGKGIGNFIRKTSLDEFPQFWNVLKGDMSLVGTRPPTVDEFNIYEAHHKARLAAKPGITGLWQVSGRSNITDFEEVVKLDKTYIREWTIGLDMRILLKTIFTVIKGEGSM